MFVSMCIGLCDLRLSACAHECSLCFFVCHHCYRLMDKSQVECLIPILASPSIGAEVTYSSLEVAKSKPVTTKPIVPSSFWPVQVKYKFCETVFTSRIICHFCIALRRRVESSWAPFDRFYFTLFALSPLLPLFISSISIAISLRIRS